MSNIDKQALRWKAEKATQGEWWSDSCGNEGAYGSGEDCVEGFTSYAVYDENNQILLDTLNSTSACIQEEYDGECHIAWDEVGQRNTEFIAAANPKTVLALLDELEAKDSTIATQQQEIRTLLNALGQSSEKRNSDLPDQKRIIGWRASDYTDETSDPELAKNWAAAIGVLPIFEGDVNTKLSAAAAGKGEAS
ncbi:TPA: ead/Ea22-like family protein [Enterobacter hormaechei]|nr:ead/Ea22-like family protein [Enterobacter hormaechei]